MLCLASEVERQKYAKYPNGCDTHKLLARKRALEFGNTLGVEQAVVVRRRNLAAVVNVVALATK